MYGQLFVSQRHAALIQQAADLLLEERETSAQPSSTPAQQQHSPTNEQMLPYDEEEPDLARRADHCCILLLDPAESSHLLNTEEQGNYTPKARTHHS